MNTFRMAEMFVQLMRELGYPKFVAQGGDFGANVSTVMAWKHPERVHALHLNYIPGSYRPHVDSTQQPMTEEERQFQVTTTGGSRTKGGIAMYRWRSRRPWP